MKTLLFVVGIFSCAMLADGQSDPGPIKISADTVTDGPTSVQLQGSVQISDGSSIITADEATLPKPPWASRVIDVRGNVHITFSPRRVLLKPR
jgi:lipopolysaccharide export system protein LptA